VVGNWRSSTWIEDGDGVLVAGKVENKEVR